jgi:hypothetical protein
MRELADDKIQKSNWFQTFWKLVGKDETLKLALSFIIFGSIWERGVPKLYKTSFQKGADQFIISELRLSVRDVIDEERSAVMSQQSVSQSAVNFYRSDVELS